MRKQTLGSRLDDLAVSHAVLTLALAWGLAEATFFFIVPDVLLTLIACRTLKPALKATVAVLIGALAGGTIMYTFGSHQSAGARAFLDHIPAISMALDTRVADQIAEKGLVAVLRGPSQGIPYKIYAVEWGARGGSLLAFLLISIPARCFRFLLASLAARGIARLADPLTHHSAAIEVSILSVVWVAFYSFYFLRFGF
jgi:membrane protein YqaA with SNARE-associated domain